MNKLAQKISVVALAGTAAALTFAGSAQAATLTQTVSATKPVTTTNYTDTLSVAQFDGSLGTLTKVTFSLAGTVLGNANAESLDAAPATVTLNLSAGINLNLPAALGGGLLVNVTPLANQVFNASAFDGTFDFAGTSGAAFTGLTNTDSDSAIKTDAPTLAFFTGLSTVNMGLVASGLSSGSGSGNLVTQFQTQAGAELQVTYEYTTPDPVVVPEPTALLGLSSVAFLGLIGRRKKTV